MDDAVSPAKSRKPGKSPAPDVLVDVMVRLSIPVPALDAVTPADAAAFAAELLAAHPLHLGGVPVAASIVESAHLS